MTMDAPPVTPDDPDPLRAEMRNWDRKSASAITAIYQAHHDTEGFASRLMTAAGDAEMESAATWLIKHHCERGETAFSEDQRARLYTLLPRFTYWEAQLHVLQMVDDLPIPAAAADDMVTYLHGAATSSKTLIRAWALYAAAQLAHQHPAYAAQVDAMLKAAAKGQPKGAVAVRLRKAQELLGQPTNQ